MPQESHPESFVFHFSVIEDPRVERTKDHALIDILVIALCAMPCGGEGFVDFAEFGGAKLAFLRSFLALPNGIPGHDAYRTCSPITYAEGLRGDLLIITGSGETNTHVEITEGLVDRLIALGKKFDYFVYPNRDHGLSEGAGSSVHVRMLIARYLIERLPPGPR